MNQQIDFTVPNPQGFRLFYRIVWCLLAVLAASAVPRATAQVVQYDPIRILGLGKVAGVAYSPDGTRVVIGAASNAYVYDRSTGQRLFELIGHGGTVRAVAYSPDGTRILTGSDDEESTGKLWDAATGELLHTFNWFIRVTTVAFSPDGSKVLMGGHAFQDVLRVHQATAPYTLLHSLSTTATSAVFSPDGQTILVGKWDETANIWDVDTGQLLRTYGVGHHRCVEQKQEHPGHPTSLRACARRQIPP